MSTVERSVGLQYLVEFRNGQDYKAAEDPNGEVPVIGSGGLPNIAVAAATRPDFAKALTAAGAWLVLPSPRLLGCFSASGGATE